MQTENKWNGTVRAYWDTTDEENPGWYVQVIEYGEIVTDSQKITFPVDVDEFAATQVQNLRAALEDEFFDHTIEISGPDEDL